MAKIGNFLLKENRKYSIETKYYAEGIISKGEIESSIKKYISKNKNVGFSLVRIDINNLNELLTKIRKKEIDKVIQDVIFKMNKSISERMLLSRIEHDKFLIFIKGEFDEKEISSVVKNIIHDISTQYVTYNGQSISFTTSSSIVFYPIHGSTYKQLLSSLEIGIRKDQEEGINKDLTCSFELVEDKSFLR